MPLSSFGKLRRLRPDERWLLAQALVLLPLTSLGLKVLGVRRWQLVLTKLAGFGKIPESDPNGPSSNGAPTLLDEPATGQQVRVITWILRIASEQGIYRPSCLQRSLVLWCLLRRRRIASEIRFGARKEAGELKAHAWVECFGMAVGEGNDVHRRFARFEGVT